MQIADVLKETPLFADLSQRDLKRLAKCARVMTYKPNQDILKEGNEGFGLFIITSGKAEVIRGADTSTPQVLGTLEQGDFFGETAIIERIRRNATVRAIEDTECVAIWRGDFRSELRAHPEVAMKMLTAVVRRLRAAEDQLSN